MRQAMPLIYLPYIIWSGLLELYCSRSKDKNSA
jgi:hypothetical protein